MEIDFENHGPLRVPTELLTKPVRGHSVVGVITHGYCLTSHAAQGDTYRAGRLLATDTSTREGVYVGLTRGETDARVYVVAYDQLDPNSRRPDDLLRVTRDIDPIIATARHGDSRRTNVTRRG